MVPDDHKPSARVRIVGQNPGEAEVLGRRFVKWHKGTEGSGEIWAEDKPRPAIGKSGWELDNKFLPLAGLSRNDVEVCNVVRCRLNRSNDLPPLTTTFARDMVSHCQRAYWKEPSEGQTLVLLGAYPLWACTGEYEGDEDDADSADDDLRASKSVDGWRGWLLPYRPQHRNVLVSPVQCFTSYHPAYFYRAHWLKVVGRMDFARLGRYLRGTWPESFPVMHVEPPHIWPNTLAFDTEYHVSYSSYESVSRVRGPLQDGRDKMSQMLRSLQSEQACALSSFAKKAQWGEVLALLSREARAFGIDTDAEVAQRVLRAISNDLRNAGGPLRNLSGDAERLPDSRVSIIDRSLSRDEEISGAALSQMQHWAWTLSRLNSIVEGSHRVSGRLTRYSAAWRDENDEPHVYVIEADNIRLACNAPLTIICQNMEADWGFIGSAFGQLPVEWEDTMLGHACLYGTLRHSLDFMGSLYARHNRWKHLQQSDPLTYSGMDALATYDIWQQLARELARDPLSESLYNTELKPLLPHVMARPSVRLNAMHIASAAQELEREQEEIAKRGEAVAGWPLNVSSADQVSRWLRLKSDV